MSNLLKISLIVLLVHIHASLLRYKAHWTDVRIFFIQKITQWKCCHPHCTLIPDPYTAPCQSSTVGSNAAGRSLIVYS
jgi:hypothetical protein